MYKNNQHLPLSEWGNATLSEVDCAIINDLFRKMNHIKVLVAHNSLIAAIADLSYLITMVNDFLKQWEDLPQNRFL